MSTLAVTPSTSVIHYVFIEKQTCRPYRKKYTNLMVINSRVSITAQSKISLSFAHLLSLSIPTRS